LVEGKMKNRTIIKMLPGEYWWGGACFDGIKMPFGSKSDFVRKLNPNSTMNQAVPLLLSDKGRYVWCNTGFSFSVKNGTIVIESESGEVSLCEGYATLRGAYLAAMRAHFPPIGKRPPDAFFVKPQFNSWIELTYSQSQKALESYAENLQKAGYGCGIFMIDDGWAPYYGKWEFNAEAFPDPAAMVKKLHAYGFKVMLWTCPFITPDTAEFRYLCDLGALLKRKDGSPAIVEWWNGFSAVLDFTNPHAEEWYLSQNETLMRRYGVDGFKFDAGDAMYYDGLVSSEGKTDANGLCELWAKIAAKYTFNELRACWKCGNLSIVQRLCDKSHTWGENGLAALVPDMLAQGLLGYAYGCPDMIGGGNFADFTPEKMKNLDTELVVRYAQCSALMPMMQFSAAPWRVLPKEESEMCLQAAKLHERFAEKIIGLADESKDTGEPIVRCMEYVFPGQGFACCIDQFMLGNDVLVVPVLEKGMRRRKVKLPGGQWKFTDGTVYNGGQTVTVDSPLHVLPYFEKCGK